MTCSGRRWSMAMFNAASTSSVRRCVSIAQPMTRRLQQTGFPLTVIEPNDVTLQSLPNRPNVICDPNDNAPHTTAQWFTTSCFQRLTLPGSAGQRGDEGRNIVRGPGFARTGLSLFKNVALASTHQIQLRIEAFNVFNQERFGQPGNIVGSPTFGAITSADDGRIVQVGIKYTF